MHVFCLTLLTVVYFSVSKTSEMATNEKEHTLAQEVSTTAVAAERFKSDFPGKQVVVLPVIHCQSADVERLLRKEELTTWKNIDIAIAAKADGVWLINHGFSAEGLVQILKATRKRYPELWIGVNWLSMGSAASRIADKKLGPILNGLWCDNGGIHPAKKTSGAVAADAGIREITLSNGAVRQLNVRDAAAELRRLRKSGFQGLYFGGVAFKYQHHVDDSVVGGDACVAADYMHVICTSGPGTGRAAGVQKLQNIDNALMMDAMRKGSPNALVALASGVTPDNVKNYLPYINAILVATGVSRDFYNLDPRKLVALVKLVNEHNATAKQDTKRKC